MKLKRLWHQSLRKLFSFLPRNVRFAIYRSFAECEPQPDARLVLKIAETQEELEACFRLLHDAYVDSGFMQPDPSGMRVTIYHALPTTTTLCAKFDGEVVGTMSLIRESVFGFPLQAIFELDGVRAHRGNIAEVSALAIHRKFRKTGGSILFPLMKFMYDYCTTFFDTRHLVIAVNPNIIEMYESLLFFRRLTQSTVDSYDFVNGAPAVGASLDLYAAPRLLERTYAKKALHRNLYQYFIKSVLPNIVIPNRRYFTTNDPVMTPELLNYFFNQRTSVFANLENHKKEMLRSIYNLPTYKDVLPSPGPQTIPVRTPRTHQRYSVKCPGVFHVKVADRYEDFKVKITELSEFGFMAQSSGALPLNTWGHAQIQLGKAEKSRIKTMVVRTQTKKSGFVHGFVLEQPDLAWKKFVSAMQSGTTHDDLENATRFLQ
jgi:hypothetical protein